MFHFKSRHNFYHNRNTLIHRFDKIMFLSCVRLSTNKYELTYLLDYVFSFNENKTLIPIKVIIPYDEYLKVIKSKFGIWIRCNYIKTNYLYIYQNLNNNKLIFKTTRNDNYLNNGTINQYNHELIFKGFLSDKKIMEYLGG